MNGGGKQLPDKLTTTEFLLVKELAKRPGIIKERAQLMDIAYREDTWYLKTERLIAM